MRYLEIAAALLLPLCGCSTIFGYDHRDKLARAILFPHDDPMRDFPSDQEFDDEVFSKALLARFPTGAPAANLQRFAESFGGRCKKSASNLLECVIPETGIICYITEIRIDVGDDNGVIASVHAYRSGVGC
jgi:hypothetical protein